MTYKERFTASEGKALDQIIATKILKEMGELRAMAQDNTHVPRRWVWELIQNAKDVYQEENGGVNIQINLKNDGDHPILVFQHDGKPFTTDNIRFLIEQISTKDRTKDEDGKRKTTGKFGTGFLSTHLLAETVKVKGIAMETDLPAKKFSVILDRSSYELSEITEAVHHAKNTILELDSYETYDKYDTTKLNTSFWYVLEDELSVSVAEKGIADLKRCLPFALIFVEEISSIYLKNEDLFYYLEKYDKMEDEDDGVQIRTIVIGHSDGTRISERHFAILSRDFTTIAIPVDFDQDDIIILPVDESVPTLFCDFPLIGTEIFPFPVIINDPHFNPTDPRDGIFLNSTEQRENPSIQQNKNIISTAIELYSDLLDHAITEEWGNLHLLANISSIKSEVKWVKNDTWFNESVLKRVRSEILYANIVTNGNEKLQSILKEDGEKYMWFPTDSRKGVREGVWKLASYWFPNRIPCKEDMELWSKLAWEDCGKLTLPQMAYFIEKRQTLENLASVISEISVHEWLNSFYALLKNSEGEYDTIIDKHAIIPDQNGDFSKRSQLSLDKGDIAIELKNILEEFGVPLRSQLADELIEMDFEERMIDQAHVVREITAEVSQKTSTRDLKIEYRIPLNHLLLFFRSYPEKSKSLFPSIYNAKHHLYDDDEILENIEKAEIFDDLLKEFNVTSVEELRGLLASSNQGAGGLLKITQDILVSMGISNVDEWEEALKDVDFRALFDHTSVPTEDMFFYAQSHIASARQNVIEHLSNLEEYDLSEMEETATTVLSGIIKYGEEINVVFRPAYDKQVIIYYGSEKDTLAHSLSELWADDGETVRQITIGHLLKKAQIKKFPIGSI